MFWDASSRRVCGHLLHYQCVVQVLKRRWAGAAISFAFLQCPMCNDSAGRKTQLVASKIVSSTY